MSDKRFGLVGAGFWSKFQLAAWQEIPGATCVAVCDRDRTKAAARASECTGAAVYDDAETMLREQSLDFIDIVSDPDSHGPLAALGAKAGVAVICQKPLAPTLEQARAMVALAERSGTRLLVHENWRWQTPLRKLKEILDSGILGRTIRARIDYANSFPVFDNQPNLKSLDRFILTDIGTHILDASRFLFGESKDLVCQTRRMREDIAGEDVATVMMRTRDDLTVTCNMSYASRWEFDRFPETMVFVEGTEGGVTLGPAHELKVFTADGVTTHTANPPSYRWADPAYDLVHSSIVNCHQNLLSDINGQAEAETTGADNLKTLELVFKSYESAASGRVVQL